MWSVLVLLHANDYDMHPLYSICTIYFSAWLSVLAKIMILTFYAYISQSKSLNFSRRLRITQN